MILKSKIGGFIIATIFSLALLLPIATQTVHALDGHKHDVCNDFSTHLHKKQLDCSICDFHFSIFDFKVPTLPEFIYPDGFCDQETVIVITEPSSVTTHFYLRGPPLLS